MEKEQAFEVVAKIIFDRAVQLIIGGNPAYESEVVLFHMEMTLTEWGYEKGRAFPVLFIFIFLSVFEFYFYIFIFVVVD